MYVSGSRNHNGLATRKGGQAQRDSETRIECCDYRQCDGLACVVSDLDSLEILWGHRDLFDLH